MTTKLTPQPMETAPRDGRPVYLIAVNHHRGTALVDMLLCHFDAEDGHWALGPSPAAPKVGYSNPHFWLPADALDGAGEAWRAYDANRDPEKTGFFLPPRAE